MSTPAVIGGEPAFAPALPFVRPTVPDLARVTARVDASYSRGMLTNGPIVREFEAAAADRLGVPHAIAVSSCTAGLMLVLRSLAPRGPVVLPSFTFSASAHAIVWNGLEPRFVECDPTSFQIDTASAAARIDGAGALLATHVFGAACDVDAVEALAARTGIPVLFDAAHGFGGAHGGRPIGGFGAAEVFSLSPTKVVVAGEGGVIATHDDALADELRIGRDYGNPGDYDTQFVGLNARMSELHAAIGVESLAGLDERLAQRRHIVDRYRSGLAELPGVAVQRIDAGDESTYKDFTIAIDEPTFGIARDTVVDALRADGIDTRCYFSPPVHRQHAYRDVAPYDLPVTDAVAGRVVSLPIYASLTDRDIDTVTRVLASLHHHADKVRAALAA
ncbi:MAG TPA: DegT/DnrJ/EryC1/StrS family aminotransferase [Acidimicrobiia bacterium]|nr:DegT/DnrJ/EryC1/StrS family aminotransferase [Acidimicrobiia bacterium]